MIRPGAGRAQGRSRHGVAARDRARLQLMQALEDAIEFRRFRATEPCLDCDPDGTPCDDHACDLMLIGKYRRSLRALAADADRRAPASRR